MVQPLNLIFLKAMDHASEGITLSDPRDVDNPIIYANQTFLSISGYPEEEVIGRNCRFMQRNDEQPNIVEQIRMAIRNQQPCTVELINYRKNGERFWNRLSVAPIFDEMGELMYFVGVQSDITEDKEREFALKNRLVALSMRHKNLQEDFRRLSDEMYAQLEVIEEASGGEPEMLKQSVMMLRQTLSPRLQAMEAEITRVTELLQDKTTR